MAFWQGMQLNFCRSRVGETAGKFSSLVAKLFTPTPLKWKHWWCMSALSEKFYCPKFILHILWVKMKLKQGHHCFSQKGTGYGLRGLQCPHALSALLTLKCKPSLKSQGCPSPHWGSPTALGEHCKAEERSQGSLLLAVASAVSWRRAWRGQKAGSKCSFTLLRDILHPEEKELPCREHKSGAAFSF